jgi:hypothetical protein
MRTWSIVLAVSAAWVWGLGCLAVGVALLAWHYWPLDRRPRPQPEQVARADRDAAREALRSELRQRALRREREQARAREAWQPPAPGKPVPFEPVPFEPAPFQPLPDRDLADDVAGRIEVDLAPLLPEHDPLAAGPQRDMFLRREGRGQLGTGRFGERLGEDRDPEEVRRERWLDGQRVERERQEWQQAQQKAAGVRPGQAASRSGQGLTLQERQRLAAANSVRKRQAALAEGTARAAREAAAMRARMEAGVRRASP